MSRSANYCLAFALFIIVGRAVLVSAQTDVEDKATAAPARGTITGRVVNESGQPLAYAVVSVRGYGGEAQEVNTDVEGNFRVTDLPPIAYLISARAPAYVPKPRDPDLNPIGYYRVGDSVRLEMMKGGVITGSVRRANGEPLVLINVTAYMIRDSKGQPLRSATLTRGQRTDDRGVYRFYGLQPGTYIVSAGGGSLSGYAVNPFATDAQTFAPSSTRDAAAEVTVNSGDEANNIDIRYRDEPGHLVSGSARGVAGQTEQQRSYEIDLYSTINGIDQVNYDSYQYPMANGFMFSGVADGEYNIVARTYTAGGWYVSESQRIKVRGADVTGIELNAKPLASMSGTVMLEDSKAADCQGKRRPILGEVVVAAWHNEKNEPRDQPRFVWGLGGPTTPDQQGAFTLRNLAAGQYRFVTRPMAKYWYLKSISWPTAAKAAQTNQPPDFARNWTTLKAGEKYAGLTITFALGAASIEGRVETPSSQKLLPRTFVYLAPAETDKREDVLRYFVSLAADDGGFRLGNVPPGRYWIVAKGATEADTNMLSKLRLPDETELRARILHDAETEKAATELKPCQNVTDYRLALRPR